MSSERRRRFAKGDCLRRSPNAWLSVFSATLVLLAAGCGGDGDGSSESQRLDPAVAEQLAAQSDAVADAIEANDGCEAVARAAELRATLDATTVPEAIRREVEPFATREFTCNPPAPPPPPPPATVPTGEEGDDDDEGGGRKKDKKDKKNRGQGDDD